MWRPSHFASEFAEIAAAVRGIKARRVIWGMVPHVTIAPIARGVQGKSRPGSRYFQYYTRPSINDAQFNPARDPFLYSNQARAIDCAIDQYNDTIVNTVRSARDDDMDGLLLDVCGILDRAAARRYALDPAARPTWWEPYPLPAPIAALRPPIDS